MPRVMIKTMDDKIATAGLHMGNDPRREQELVDGKGEWINTRRKLEPGEVMEIPDDLTIVINGQEVSLFDALWSTGALELTKLPVTRPLDYRTSREAKLCSPSFRSKGPDDDKKIAEAKAAVVVRLAEDEQPAAPFSRTKKESPAVKAPSEPESANPRARRRRAVANRAHSEENPT